MESKNIPSKKVLSEFGTESEPKLLPGGQGNTYQAGKIVLKLAENPEVTNWVANLLSNINENGFRVEKPVKTISDKWVFDGWCAFSYLDGKETKTRWYEKIQVSRKFHEALSGISKPKFIAKLTHPWGIADKMVWGEIPLTYSPRLKKVIAPLEKELKPINLNNQLIHGDMTGNILFSDFAPPAIIDMSPYFRPKEYASAIIVTDSIVWDHAPDAFLDVMENDFNSNQLLIRAAMWRIKTKEEFVRQYGYGDISEVDMYEHLIDLLLKRVNIFRTPGRES